MAKYEEKFIVINKKRLDELNERCPQGMLGFTQNQAVMDLLEALEIFKQTYEDNIGPMNQKYYVCNQDEPYADEVFGLILKGEEKKEKGKMLENQMKEWIDNATYEQLFEKWRFAPAGDSFFQGEVGDYYRDVMAERREEVGEEEHVKASKRIGWVRRLS